MKRAYVLLLVLVVITNLVVPSWGFFFHSSSSIAPPSSSLPSRKNDAEKMKTSSSVPSLLPAFQLFFALITPVASMSEPASAATPPKGIDFTTISKLQGMMRRWCMYVSFPFFFHLLDMEIYVFSSCVSSLVQRTYFNRRSLSGNQQIWLEKSRSGLDKSPWRRRHKRGRLQQQGQYPYIHGSLCRGHWGF